MEVDVAIGTKQCVGQEYKGYEVSSTTSHFTAYCFDYPCSKIKAGLHLKM
jgi:hypothetical protein